MSFEQFSQALKTRGVPPQSPREAERRKSFRYEVSLRRAPGTTTTTHNNNNYHNNYNYNPTNTNSRLRNPESTSRYLLSGSNRDPESPPNKIQDVGGPNKYRNPFSRGDGRNIPTERLQEYAPPEPFETDESREWNEGDALPDGGPLPFDKVTKTALLALETAGSGTEADPMVLFSNREIELMKRRSKRKVEAHVAFAKHVAQKLKFTHIWIRKAAHDVETNRQKTTGLFTGETRPSQSHLTVLLGHTDDWVIVGGHIFVLTTKAGDLELMPSEQMWQSDSGRGGRRRVIELWKWDEGKRLRQEHTSKECRDKLTWRREH
ncbi:hypothetical protein GGR50DRAFT_318806 [Xylaria sp. CBS 124048]|nr:hypothetical protein GGR50DRAFT_318806 [Xylaria sp. CBS 124048]